MMSLYDVTESVTVITVPKDRRNGARYGLTACVCVCRPVIIINIILVSLVSIALVVVKLKVFKVFCTNSVANDPFWEMFGS